MSEPVFGPRQALPLDLVMAQSEDRPWDFLDRLLDPRGGRAAELENSATRIGPLVYRLALSREGREILEWLCDITVRRPHFIAGMGIEQAALYGASREGQDGVVFALLKAARQGQDIEEQRS